MINIGPWWIYDFIFLAIIVAFLVMGIRKGLYTTLMILGLEVLTIVVLLVVPPLIINAIDPFVFKSIYKSTWLHDFISRQSTMIESILNKILNETISSDNPINLDTSQFLEQAGAFATTIIFKIVLEIVIFVIFNILIFGLYFGLNKKLGKIKINKYASATLGAFFALLIGLSFVSFPVIIISNPIFELTTQKIKMTNDKLNDEETKKELLNRIKYGNKFKQKALSSKASYLIPPIFFDYSAVCLNKYIVPAATTVFKYPEVVEDFASAKGVLSTIEDVIVKGYLTNDAITVSVSSCLDNMPDESFNVVRVTIESILVASALSDKKDDVETNLSANASILFRDLDKYQKNHGGKKLDEKAFIDFYDNWSEKDNQFLKSANNQKDQNSEITNVLRNPKKLYRFMKNIYEVNANKNSKSLFDAGPSIYSSYKIMQGLEFVPSGIMNTTLGLVKETEGIPVQTYNFELKKYMSYVRGQDE